MKKFFKKFLSNPWSIAIISPLILAIITPLWISWWKNINLSESINFITEKLWNIFNYRVPIWFILTVVIFLLISLIVIKILINTLGNTQSSSKLKYPDWYYSFKEMAFKEWLFTWKYDMYWYSDNKIEFSNLTPICYCKCNLVTKFQIENRYYTNGALQCPSCKKIYNIPTDEDIEEVKCLILHKINTN